jgi:hypothetical protein
MRLAKLTALVVTFVLVLQSGCDFFCQHAEEMASQRVQGNAVPPCHSTGSGENSNHQDQHRDHQTAKDCLHLQAIDDGSKLQTKVVKASQPVAIVALATIQVLVHSRVPVLATDFPSDVKPSGPSSPVLRI